MSKVRHKVLRSQAEVPESAGELGLERRLPGPNTALLPLKPQMGNSNVSATRAGDLSS